MRNAEVPSVRHSVIGDLDHGEYDLQRYVDALLSLSLLDDSID